MFFRAPNDVDTTRCQEFYLGQTNDGTLIESERAVMFDEFNFWSTFKQPDEVKELGRWRCSQQLSY